MAEQTKKRSFISQKTCRFCNDDNSKVYIDFFDTKALKPLISERGKIIPARISGNCAKCQRLLTRASKSARNIALLPFSVQH